MGQNNVRFRGKPLGKGSYGEVYKAKWKGQLVAVKRIHPLLVQLDLPNDQNGIVANFIRECELLRRLRHDNILNIITVITDGRKPPILITELLDCDLEVYFDERNSDLLLEELVTIMVDVAKGLQYLHELDEPIIHRDLCPKNILLDRSNPSAIKAKIADVGLAKILGERSRELSPVPGTQSYMAPETYGLAKLKYGTEIDVFSFGMTLLRGILGYMPSPQANPLALSEDATVHALLKAHLQAMGENNPLRKLVLDCLKDEPSKRPTAAQIVDILSHPTLMTVVVKYDFQDIIDKVCEDFHRWIPVRRRTIRELEEMNLDEMTTKLDKIHRDVNIATAAGASTSVVATGLVVGGFISSFFTFGATIPVMIAGGCVAAAGGLTTFGAKMSEIFLSRININKVEDTIAEDKVESEHLRKSMEQLDCVISKNVQRIFDEGLREDKNLAADGITNVMEHFQKVTGVNILETDQLDPFKSSARAVGAVLSVTTTGVTASTAGARIGTAVFDTLSVASRATHVAGFVASVITLPIDAYFLVKSVREIKNHSPSEIADKIRAIQDKMVCPQEGEIPSLVNTYVEAKVAESAREHLKPLREHCDNYDMIHDLDQILLEHDKQEPDGQLSCQHGTLDQQKKDGQLSFEYGPLDQQETDGQLNCGYGTLDQQKSDGQLGCEHGPLDQQKTDGQLSFEYGPLDQQEPDGQLSFEYGPLDQQEPDGQLSCENGPLDQQKND